jgi:arylsulfatase A-like enzyme
VMLRRKSAAMLNRNVLGWLGNRPAGRPYFVFINYYDAHRPYVFHDDPTPRFGLATLPTAEQLEIDKRFLDLAAKPAPAQVTPQLIEEGQQIVNEAFTLYHDCYDSCIAYLDRQVGLLLDEMERLGSLENTLVIVTSDHGEQIGEHGLVGHGTSVYRSEVHVPLLVIPPERSAAGRIVHEPVSVRQIPATVADRVDLGPRNPFPGRSLSRFSVEGTERLEEPSAVLCELQHNIAFPETHHAPSSFVPVSSLVSRDRVYIRRDDGHEELYDRLYDPLESVDLAKDPQSRATISRFRAELSQLQSR